MIGENGDDRSTVSWRRQALLWPAVCSGLVSAGYGLLLIPLGGFALLAWLPVVMVVSVIAFGGGAIVIGLAVRTVFRWFAPNAPAPFRTTALAVTTGVGETLGTVLVVGAAQVDGGSSPWGWAVGIGIVATLAASTYARDLFAEVPEPIDWNREV